MIKTLEAFDLKINPLKRTEFFAIVSAGIKNRQQLVQNGINAAGVNDLYRNEEYKKALRNSDLINIDGMSVVWALRFMGYHVPERVACPDLALDIISLARKEHYSIFLLGASERNIILCETNLMAMYPGLIIAGIQNGYFAEEDEKQIVTKINELNPDILLLGMPSPKKELFVDKYRNELNVRYFLGVGGFFDIIAGNKRRAPEWIQKLGLEWLYRLSQEPGKLWKRYLIGNIKFILLVIRQKFKRGTISVH